MGAVDHTVETRPVVAGAKPDSPGALAERARSAVFWTTGLQVFWDLLQFGVTLALVRLLPAEAYGQFGFVTTLIGFLSLYTFREMLGYTLQVRADDRVHYQDHFTAGAVIQLAMCAVVNAIAVGLRWFPAYAAAAPALHLMSVIVLLDLPSEFRVKMLERLLDWRRLRLLHAAGLVLSAALSIYLAVAGWGVYALLLPLFLVPVPFIYDLFVRARWRPTWQWRWSNYQPAWRFGSSRMLAVSFVSGAGLVESAWLVSATGFAALGVFGRAVGLAQRSCQRIGATVATSVYPVLTRVEPRTPAYRRAGALFLRSVAWVVVPIACVAALLSSEIVALLYGGRWLGVVPLLPWAMAGGAIAALVQTAYTLLLAHQRADRCLHADIWRFAGTLIVLGAALPFGLGVYLIGLVGVHLVSLVLVLRWLHQDDGLAGAGVTHALVPPAAAAALAIGCVVGVRAMVGPALSGVWSLAPLAALFGSVYLLTLRAAFRAPLAEVVGYLPGRERLQRWLRLPEAA